MPKTNPRFTAPSAMRLFLFSLYAFVGGTGLLLGQNAMANMTSGVSDPALASSMIEPIALDEALRLALEEPKQFLTSAPAWLSGPYAAAHPVWVRDLLIRKLFAGTSLSDPVIELECIAALEKLAEAANMPEARAYALFRRGRAARREGDLERFTSLSNEGIDIMNASSDPALKGLAQLQLCNMHYSRKEFVRALPFCEKARPLFDAGGDQYMMAATESTISNIFEAIERDDDAINMAEQARNRYLGLKLYTTAAMLNDNVSAIYLDRGEPEKALAISQAALQMELAGGRLEFAISSRQSIANVLIAMGRHQEALQMIAVAIAEAKRIKHTKSLADSHIIQMLAAEGAKQYPLALEAARNAIAALQTLAEEQSNTAVAEMSARFQAKEQQREIDTLAQQQRLRALELAQAQQENHTQAVRLSSQRLWLWLIAVVMTALALVCALLLMLWRKSRQYAAKMRHLADTDGLTGVLNRRAVMERMHALYQQAQSIAEPACLFIVDADHFKQINDTHGHQAGDAALQRIATILSAELPAAGAVGRLGGEEFAVLLPACDAQSALVLANRMCENVANPKIQSDAVHFPMAVSIGIAELDPSKNDFVQWFALADRAVYAAKAQGRNRVALAA